MDNNKINIKKQMATPLSSNDLKKFNPDIIFKPYNELRDLTLKALKLPMIILYLSDVSKGHYCCMFKNKEGLNFYDPYGIYIDGQFKFLKKDAPKYNYKGMPYISSLLLQAPPTLPLIYNEFQFQKLDNSIATCGYHCLLRIKFSNLNQSQYVEFMKNMKKRTGLSFDELAVSILLL